MVRRRRAVAAAVAAGSLPILGLLSTLGASSNPAPVAAVGDTITCDRNAANDAALDTQVAAATSGQVVCITAAGSYSTSGTDDNTSITITAQAGVSPTLTVSLNNGDSGLTINGRHATWDDTTGIVITGGGISGTPGPSVTIRDTWFEGNALQSGEAATFHVDGPSTAAILLDHNVHYGTGVGTEAAIRNDTSDNLTIQNSLFRDLEADGVKAGGATDTNVLANKFLGINDAGNPALHTDAIQINSSGARMDVIGNWVTSSASEACNQAITSFDEMLASVYQHNVVVGCSPHTMTIQMDDEGSDISHNTVVSSVAFSCDTPAGKHSQYPGAGVSTPDLYNNLFQPGMTLGDCSPASNDHNVTSSSGVSFVGGSTPASFDEFCDFVLTGGSTGKTGARDGTEVGMGGGGFDCSTDGPPSGEGY